MHACNITQAFSFYRYLISHFPAVWHVCPAQPASPIESCHVTDRGRPVFLQYFVFRVHFNCYWHFLRICSDSRRYALLSCSCLYYSRMEVKTFPGCLPHTSTPGAFFLAQDMGKAGCLVALHMNIFQCSASLLPHVRRSTSAASTPHLPLAIPFSFSSVLLCHSWGGREERTCTVIIPLSHHTHVMTGPSRLVPRLH